MHKYYIINDKAEFHPATRTLTDLDNPENIVMLNSPSGRCLLLLIERAGTIITQQEFIDNVWAKHGMIVSPNAFYQNICFIRKSMKKIGFTTDLIVTIPRIGLTLLGGTKIKTNDLSVTKRMVSHEMINTANDQVVVSNAPQERTRSDDSDKIDKLLKQPEIVYVNDDKSKIKTTKPNHYRSGIILTVLILIIYILGFGFIDNHANSNRDYFDDFRSVKNINGCYFFVDRDLSTEKSGRKHWLWGERMQNIVLDALGSTSNDAHCSPESQ